MRVDSNILNLRDVNLFAAERVYQLHSRASPLA